MAHQLHTKRYLPKGWCGFVTVFAVAMFLLLLFVGPLLLERTPSTAPELSSSAVQAEAQKTARPQASPLGTELSPSTPSLPKSGRRQPGALAETPPGKGRRLPDATETAAMTAAEAKFDQERRWVEHPESAIYTETQLSELDPETISLVGEEIWQGVEAANSAGDEELNREEMENFLAELTAELEAESLLMLEGVGYTEAQLNELAPETIELFAREISLAEGSPED